MRIWILVFCLCAATASAQPAGGVKWAAPAGWKIEGPLPMRAATYTAAAAAGDAAGGECAVYFFGAGQGGGIQENIARWEGQFTAADGKASAAKVATRKSAGLTITTVDTSGSYSGMGGPMGGGRAVGGYRLLGAIIEGPGGNIFVKFTGPTKTIAANEARFEQLLASFQPVR